MKRFGWVFNVILVAALGGSGCNAPPRKVASKFEMAVFGEAFEGGGPMTWELSVPRASQRTVWIDSEALFWVADGLQGAEVVRDGQGLEILRLWLTSAGSRQFESITSRYGQRNLFFLSTLPDPAQPGRFKEVCIGTYRVEGVVASRVVDVIPDASSEELEYMVAELNRKVGAE